MTKEHPIAPPSEDRILKWSDEWFEAKVKHMTREKHLCMQAARWGADQELEACCEWLDRNNQWARCDIDELHDARRPKPLSLKEQALALVNSCNDPDTDHLDDAALDTIRRALEQLDD